MKRKLVFILFPIILLFSCNKEVTDVNPDYIGNWIGPDAGKTYYLNISDNSKTKFITEDDNGNTEEKNGIMRIKDNQLIMKNIFVYEILESPHELDSNITFVLHDYEYSVSWRMKLKAPKSWGGGVVYYYK